MIKAKKKSCDKNRKYWQLVNLDFVVFILNLSFPLFGLGRKNVSGRDRQIRKHEIQTKYVSLTLLASFNVNSAIHSFMRLPKLKNNEGQKGGFHSIPGLIGPCLRAQ